MSNELETIKIERRPKEYFEEEIAVRGYRFSLSDIEEVYTELSRINHELGQRMVASLHKDENATLAEWENYKLRLLDDAFRLTITFTGQDDVRIYAEDAAVFRSENLPKQIKSIYITNSIAYQRNARMELPRNRVEAVFDFSKPPLLEADSILSEATPNISEVRINADDISFIRSVQQVVDAKVKRSKTWYGMLHIDFAYDLGLWLFALPITLVAATHYMDQFLPISSEYASYRWALFIYLFGTFLLVYRFVTSYAKWAFPVNVLTENKDRALKHRLAIAGISGWICYKLADVGAGLFLP